MRAGFRPLGLLLVGLACLLPVVAVYLVRGATVVQAPTATTLLPTPRGPGLQPLLFRQDLHPAQLADRYLARFPLGNGSDRPVTVTGMTSTCGCAALRVVPPTIPPGGWGELVMELTGRGRFGALESQVELRTDDGRPPVVVQAHIRLPPLPRVAADEVRLPAGQDVIAVPVAGGDARFALRCLDGPTSSSPAFTASFASAAEGCRLDLRLTGARPAASRVRLRVGYDDRHAVDLALRIIAE